MGGVANIEVWANIGIRLVFSTFLLLRKVFLLSRRVAGEAFSAFGALLREIWAPLGGVGRLLVSLGLLLSGQGAFWSVLVEVSGTFWEVLGCLRDPQGRSWHLFGSLGDHLRPECCEKVKSDSGF